MRKIATSKRLRVRIIHVYQTFGKNLQVISPVCQQKKILLAKLCKWTKKLTSSLDHEFINSTKWYMYDYMRILYFRRKGLLNFQCLTRNYATFLSNMYKYILNMYMYIIHMHCTVCKERPLLLKADAFLIRIMDLLCNLPKRQLKFLADIRGNSNYIITV